MSSMITVNRRFTRVPMGSGCCDLMNTPVREMFVTYSWMKASNDSNSLLIVTRSSPRLSDSLIAAPSMDPARIVPDEHLEGPERAPPDHNQCPRSREVLPDGELEGSSGSPRTRHVRSSRGAPA